MIKGLLDNIETPVNIYEHYKFVIFDLETTGLSYKTDDMIEFAAGKYSKTDFKVDYHTYVFTDKIIPQPVVRLTGVSQAKVRNAPKREDVIKEIGERYKGCIFVGHNMTSFDSRFLLKDDKSTFENFYFLDTLTLSRKLLPGLKDIDNGNHKLKTLCDLFGIELNQHHTANADITATNYLLAKLLGLLNNISDIEAHLKKGQQIKINV